MALVTKNFSDIITFTRASTATFFNSSGVLTSAAINAPRFDYDPSTLAARGLLIEETRTNLQVNSENPAGTGWVQSDLTVSSNATTAPSGVSNAAKLIPNTNNTVHHIECTSTVVASTQYIASVFLKAAEETVAVLWNNVGGAIATFNLSAGTITSGSGTITSVGNGWYRCSISYTPSGTAGQVRVYVRQSTAYAGNGLNGLFIWGAQLEAGAFPTSYIPTTTTALTRSADVAAVNTLAPWFNSVSGTVFCQGLTPPGLANFPAIGPAFSDGTTSNRMIQYVFTNGFYGAATTSGASQGSTAVSVTPTIGAQYKFATAYANNDSQSALNGTASTVDSTYTVPTVNQMQINTGGAASANLPNSWIQRITYYPRRLSQAELTAITA